ncbi:unnamed protein product, partial [Meganyctiphanes norvegica]
HDTTIRESDMVSLKEGNWINDSIVAFWLEYLQREICGEDKGILFVSPAMSQIIKLGEKNDIDYNLNAIGAWRNDYLFLPVNNNESKELQGGSHWSLLVYSRFDNAWYHYDSLEGANTNPALKLVERLNMYLEFEKFQYLLTQLVHSKMIIIAVEPFCYHMLIILQK